MREGAERSQVEYVWPQTLRVPARPPRLFYLDLNHWITLAKVVSGHRDGRDYRDFYDTCERAVRANRAVFPISSATYMEVSKIGQYRQRCDVRQVIEQLSQFAVVTARTVVTAHEVEAALDKEVGVSPRPVNTMAYLDWGVMRAFGLDGRLRVKSSETGEDVTHAFRAEYRDGPAVFDAIVASAERKLNRMVLDGPDESQVGELRVLGWDPYAAARIAEDRAVEEQEQARRFDSEPRWRKGRIRDVVSARELIIEIMKPLSHGLIERRIQPDAFLGDREQARRLVDSMPSCDVAVSLKTSYHADGNHRWSANDIHDIDALGATIPYCDVVVTDRAVVSAVQKSGLDKRLKAVVIADLEALAEHL